MILARTSEEGAEPFEVWLACSSAAMGGAKNLSVGDVFACDGHWSQPVRSHRVHGGLHKCYELIPFFVAGSCQKQDTTTT